MLDALFFQSRLVIFFCRPFIGIHILTQQSHPTEAVAKRSRASCTIERGSLLLSRPRVKGTTQKVHILSHPRMMEMKAVTPLEFSRTGLMSACFAGKKGVYRLFACPLDLLSWAGRDKRQVQPLSRRSFFFQEFWF
jgi:hypothetical protein